MKIFLAATYLALLASGCLARQQQFPALEAPALAESQTLSPPKAILPDAMPQSPLPLVNPKIVVSKSRRKLELYSDDRVIRTYRIGLGLSPIEDKVRQGDHRTPEGEFYVCVKNANSKFYLSLGLSYPNMEDAARGLRDGLITKAQHDRIMSALKGKKRPPWDTALGGEIFIHGNGSQSDWTWGCVALEDAEMKELFDAVPLGTRVIIEK